MNECIFVKETGRKSKGNAKFAIFICGYCGKEFETLKHSIKWKRVKSCGCHRRSGVGHIKHNMCNSLEYESWVGMRSRCFNKKNSSYQDYGGRGISVCDRWADKKNGFKNFYEDMGPRPNKSYTIDRRNNSGNYCPENCYWATKEEQHNNKRSNIFYTYKNETKTLAQWARSLNINNQTLHQRIKRGWSIEKVLETPIRKSKNGMD